MTRAVAAAAVSMLTVGATASTSLDLARGRTLYEQHCLVCHQADGGGVPYFQPPLIDAPWVVGEPKGLAAFVLSGGFDSASRKGGANDNVMPAFDGLADGDLAMLLSYVRQAFGSDAGPVTADDVAAAREMIEQSSSDAPK